MENMELNSYHFFKNKNVIITGHTGFKGSWLSIWLQLLGANVLGIGLEPTSRFNNFHLSNCSENMHSVIGDIRDNELVRKSFQFFKPDILFHLAAQPLVETSYAQPEETFSTNIMGLISILEAARSCSSLRVMVNVTSDKCYEISGSVNGYSERDPLGGNDPYSASKACAELVSASYQKSFFSTQGQTLVTARAGNVIGGGDWTRGRLIPDILHSVEQDQSLVLRFPDAIRPWQHVLEPLSGYLMLAQKLWDNPKKYVGAWNFGPSKDDEQMVISVASALLDKLAARKPIILETVQQFNEAKTLKLDISKSHEILNWKPKWTLMKTLDSIVWWQNKFLQKDNMFQACQHQIESYSND